MKVMKILSFFSFFSAARRLKKQLRMEPDSAAPLGKALQYTLSRLCSWSRTT
jgi:hypothetical protein